MKSADPVAAGWPASVEDAAANVEPLFLPESSEPPGPRFHARVVALVAAERREVRAVDPLALEVTWPR